MSSPADRGPVDPHDPRFDLDRQENLVLLALGEPVDPAFDTHRRGCARCAAELAGYARTVQVARESGEHREHLEATPAPRVWDGIAAELGLPTTATGGRPAQGWHRVRWTPGWLRGLLVAAVLIVALAAAGVGYLAGRHTTGSSVPVAATAQLAAMPGGPAPVSGTAIVRSTSGGAQLTVTTRGLPLRDGYYEVWMFNPASNHMVAVGTLADNGAGTFPMPPGLDPHAYHVVDVSAQNYDGNPAHQQSVLRGGLTQ